MKRRTLVQGVAAIAMASVVFTTPSTVQASTMSCWWSCGEMEECSVETIDATCNAHGCSSGGLCGAGGPCFPSEFYLDCA
jgi:hypothetical protein